MRNAYRRKSAVVLGLLHAREPDTTIIYNCREQQVRERKEDARGCQTAVAHAEHAEVAFTCTARNTYAYSALRTFFECRRVKEI